MLYEFHALCVCIWNEILSDIYVKRSKHSMPLLCLCLCSHAPDCSALGYGREDFHVFQGHTVTPDDHQWPPNCQGVTESLGRLLEPWYAAIQAPVHSSGCDHEALRGTYPEVMDWRISPLTISYAMGVFAGILVVGDAR